MKFQVIPFLLITPLLLQAQEPNPFVKKNGAKAAEFPSGPSLVNLVEYILVPPGLIDPWIEKNGNPEDATALRAAVQEWVNQGKAKLDHTALTNASIGTRAVNESVLEQIYPTEYMPGGPGVWPVPTSFETRNAGYNHMLESGISDGGSTVSLETERVETVPSASWHLLAEKTRAPGDIFLPTFRATRATQQAINLTGEPDPFGSAASGGSRTPNGMKLASGGTRLAGRSDPPAGEEKGNAMSQLIFSRNAVAGAKEPTGPVAKIRQISYKFVRVPHRAYSDWLQGRDLLKAPVEAWTAFAPGGKDSEDLGGSISPCASGDRTTMENIVEFIYPTEWEPANISTVIARRITPDQNDKEGKLAVVEKRQIQSYPGMEGASLATSFETRNLGSTLDAEVISEPDGIMVRFSMDRVLRMGQNVYRRIEVNNEWVPDIMMPLFASDRITSSVRMGAGAWTLVASGADFLPPGTVDHDRCVLFFVKVE